MTKNNLSIAFPAVFLPKRKQTSLGLYITAKEAYAKWLNDPTNIKIIDCRTPEEYILIGHAPMAHNIPSSFMTSRFDEKNKRFIMENNPDFVNLIRDKFNQDETILIICRSGSRSARAVNKLAEAGYKKVYTVTDGFEGDKAENGWKNVDNPWSYKLDPNLIYRAENKKLCHED